MFVCSAGHADFVVCTFPKDLPTIIIERISPDVDFLVESIVQDLPTIIIEFLQMLISLLNLLSKLVTFTLWPYTRTVGKMVYLKHCNAYKG